MIWQDWIFSIVMIFFSYALIPQIYLGFKQKRGFVNFQTSLITFLGMYILAITYLTMELYFSVIIAFITGTFWFILFVQKIIYK